MPGRTTTWTAISRLPFQPPHIPRATPKVAKRICSFFNTSGGCNSNNRRMSCGGEASRCKIRANARTQPRRRMPIAADSTSTRCPWTTTAPSRVCSNDCSPRRRPRPPVEVALWPTTRHPYRHPRPQLQPRWRTTAASGRLVQRCPLRLHTAAVVGSSTRRPAAPPRRTPHLPFLWGCSRTTRCGHVALCSSTALCNYLVLSNQQQAGSYPDPTKASPPYAQFSTSLQSTSPAATHYASMLDTLRRRQSSNEKGGLGQLSNPRDNATVRTTVAHIHLAFTRCIS